MLFYYFNSKKELYYDLILDAIRIVKEYYFEQIDDTQTDFIEKYKQTAELKMKAAQNYPNIYNFFAMAYLDKDNDLPAAVSELIEEIRLLFISKIYTNIDFTKFREDLPAHVVYKLIKFTMDGYEKDLVERLKYNKNNIASSTELWDEYYEYLDILKRVYYKQ